MRTILILTLSLASFAPADDTGIKSLGDSAFRAGAQIGFVIGSNFGNQKDLNTVVEAHASNRVEIAVAVLERVRQDGEAKLNNYSNIVSGAVTALRATTNYINNLVESGKLCEVRGHVWVGYLNTHLVYEPNVLSRRQCGNCKLIQTQRIGSWE